MKIRKLDENLLKKIKEGLEREEKENYERGKKIYEDLPYNDRLALVGYISRVLFDHAREGGTYRYLIYDRLGFDLDAYTPLFMAGLFEIHNMISGELKWDDNIEK